MSTARTFIQKYSVASYFALTFVISWGGILMVIAIAGTGIIASPADFERLIPVWAPLLVLGPSLSGVVMTGVTGGRSGVRDYRGRLVRFGVGVRDYAVAVLTGPACYVATSLVLASVDRRFLPAIVTTDDPAGLLGMGIPVALLAGIFEELGWTGFAVPALMQRYTATRTGLIVGVLWGLWHFMPKLFGAAVGDAGVYWPLDMACAVVGLTGFRILMVWVYARTASLPIAILMHAGITGSMTILQPTVTGMQFVEMVVVLAVAPWIVVAASALVGSRGAAPRHAGRVTRARRARVHRSWHRSRTPRPS